MFSLKEIIKSIYTTNEIIQYSFECLKDRFKYMQENEKSRKERTCVAGHITSEITDIAYKKERFKQLRAIENERIKQKKILIKQQWEQQNEQSYISA
jgi:hypothetical protein